jgi:hypothetical protein
VKKNFTVWLMLSAAIMLFLPWSAVTLVKRDAGKQADQREDSGDEDKNKIWNGNADFMYLMPGGIHAIFHDRMESDTGGSAGTL